ncbi:hypothetical protein NA57DRAFT_71890 [Rhizodiscina lignyota]|uniref:Basic proline-rich protein n=1 Tax=Rhizodiscina lignyota TaxID=1504668 RepID=A0A9P4IJT5_9PEZI|nr:hypothetical protein NA57DRAFT_71890 [Rhizodiscina lignyota]
MSSAPVEELQTPPATPPNKFLETKMPEPTTPSNAALRALTRLNIQDAEGEYTSPESRQSRPYAPRCATDPSTTASPPQPPRSPRNRSPLSRSHNRSQSTNSPLMAPPMVRAHSSPSYMTSSNARSTSPLRSPRRVRSPFRIPTEDEPSVVASPSAMYDIEVISEDSELDLTPRALTADKPIQTYLSPSPSLSPHFTINPGNTFPGSRRRRPASPLHQVANATFPSSSNSAEKSSAQSSPLLGPAKFNESFPGEIPLRHARSFSSSSVPSTPTSARSRSPSISSLETIPDTPDAEEAAAEADRIARLRAPSDGEGGGIRRGSLDIPGQRSGAVGFGFGTAKDKRKRWSVCGAESRRDLDLETIWED